MKDSSPFPTGLITTIPKTIKYPTTIPTAIEERKEDELIQKLSPTTSDPTATTTTTTLGHPTDDPDNPSPSSWPHLETPRTLSGANWSNWRTSAIGSPARRRRRLGAAGAEVPITGLGKSRQVSERSEQPG